MTDPADAETVGQLALFAVDAPAVTYCEETIDVGRVHLCGGCNRVHPLSHFTPHPYGRGGLGSCVFCRTRNVRVTRGVARQDAAMQPPEGQCCEVCGSDGEPRGMFLDHNHQTGRFRGWLCIHCNTGLGNMRDDPHLLRRAAEYIDRRGGYSLRRAQETA